MLRYGILALALCASACSGEHHAPLSVTDVTVTRPLPGTSMSAGYFTIENHGSSMVVITAIDSPQFARVDMHETVIENDVSRMRSIDALQIEPGKRVRFEPGGKHLMLTQADAIPDTVTLNFLSGETLLLSVSTSPTDL